MALPIGGFYRARFAGERHAYEAQLIHTLQESLSREDYSLFKRFSAQVRAGGWAATGVADGVWRASAAGTAAWALRLLPAAPSARTVRC